jgi:hypothetical protein
MNKFENLAETHAGDLAEHFIKRFYVHLGYTWTYSGKHRLSPDYQGPVIGSKEHGARRAPDFYLERCKDGVYEDFWLECKGKYGPTFHKQPYADFDNKRQFFARWETGVDADCWRDYWNIVGEHYHRCIYIAFLHGFAECVGETNKNLFYEEGLYVANLYELYAAGRYGTGRGSGMVYFDMGCFDYHSLSDLFFDESQEQIFSKFRDSIQRTKCWARDGSV